MFVTRNTVSAIVQYFHNELDTVYSKSEVSILLEICFEHFLGFSKIDLKTKADNHLSESELLDFHFTLKRLRNLEPIQYILEEAPFYGLKFHVNSNVLIPRPETEELVYILLEKLKPNDTILDIGTGSGCIPITLKSRQPDLSVYAIDISDQALDVARRNGEVHNVAINWIGTDILKVQDLNDIISAHLDCIISNPPYVREMEKKEMSKSVLQFEPNTALFVEDDNPLIFYKKIIMLAKKKLKSEGLLIFEVNQYLANEVKNMMTENNFKKVEINKDINNNDRIVYGYKI